jgi:hypothetical protein
MMHLMICAVFGCSLSIFLLFFSTYQWSADVLLARVVHDKDVVRLHQLFFHARGREEDVVFMLDRDAAAGARHPAKSVELPAERADQIGWVFRVLRFDERVSVVVLSGGSHVLFALLA